MIRVMELQSGGARRAEVTVESLLLEAEEVRAKALEAGQFSAAISAIKEKGVLSGKRIERSEAGKPGDFSRMADDELEQFISQRARGVSVGVAGARTARGAEAPDGSGRPH